MAHSPSLSREGKGWVRASVRSKDLYRRFPTLTQCQMGNVPRCSNPAAGVTDLMLLKGTGLG